MELEEDYRREGSSHNGSEHAYSVEARYNYSSTLEIAGQIFDNRWRQVNYEKSPIGVPSRSSLISSGLLGYASAQALRWWLYAVADMQSISSLCLETRLVMHKISFTQKTEAVSAHEHIHGGDRSNIMPDWGKK